MEYGTLLVISRTPRGGAISRRRYPFACFGHTGRRFRAFHLPRAKIRTARPAQAFSLGNPVSVSRAHRGKAGFRSLRERARRCGQACARCRSSGRIDSLGRASEGCCARRCWWRSGDPPCLPPSKDCLTVYSFGLVKRCPTMSGHGLQQQDCPYDDQANVHEEMELARIHALIHLSPQPDSE